MELSQQRVSHGIFALTTIGSGLSVPAVLINDNDPVVIGSAITAFVLCAALWLAYWRGWQWARYVMVLLLAVITPFSYIGGQTVTEFDPGLFIAPVVALILAEPIWIGASAVISLGGMFAIVGAAQPYTNPFNLLVYLILAGCMMFSRAAMNQMIRDLSTSNTRAERARRQAEHAQELAVQQAAQLVTSNAEQQQLLDLVSVLEIPTVSLADDVLFAPIVGHLDSRRAEELTQRLLDQAHEQRARLIIMDVTALAVMDTTTARSLLQTSQALRLLGCQVTISGISAATAHTLVQQGVDLADVRTVRTPQEAMAT